MVKFVPKRFKYNRSFVRKNVNKGTNLFTNVHVDTYQVGFVALENAYVFKKEVMSMYRFLKKGLDKKMKIRFHLDFVHTFTSKSVGMRMGKGKGPRREFFSIVKPGTVFIELYLDKKMTDVLRKRIQKVLDGFKKRLSFRVKELWIKY